VLLVSIVLACMLSTGEASSTYKSRYRAANSRILEATASIYKDSQRQREIRHEARGGPLSPEQQAEHQRLADNIVKATKQAHEGHKDRQEAERIASYVVSERSVTLLLLRSN
jgi:hypothetical protein